MVVHAHRENKETPPTPGALIFKGKGFKVTQSFLQPWTTYLHRGWLGGVDEKPKLYIEIKRC